MLHAMNHAWVPSHTITLVTIENQELEMNSETLAKCLGLRLALTTQATPPNLPHPSHQIAAMVGIGHGLACRAKSTSWLELASCWCG